MNLRDCTCGEKLTTKNVKKVGRMELGEVVLLLVNCLKCHTTVSIASRMVGARKAV